jgi:hypothetical protein
MNKTRRRKNPRRKSYGGNSLDECPICYESLHPKGDKKVFKTKCGHSFHVECLYPICIVRPSSCPMCRNNLATNEKDTNSDCEKVYLQMILDNHSLTDFGILRIMKDKVRQNFQFDTSNKKELFLVEKLKGIEFKWFDPNSYCGPQKWNMFQDLIDQKIIFFIKKYKESSASKSRSTSSKSSTSSK